MLYFVNIDLKKQVDSCDAILSRLTHSHLIGQNHVGGIYAHFNSLILYGVMFKVTLFVQQGISQHGQAMPNWNFVKRQLKFDKPRYLFTKTHKTQMCYDKNSELFIYLIGKHHHNLKQWSALLTLTTFSMT